MQETWQIGGLILESSSMSIINLSSGKVDDIKKLRLQVLGQSLLLLGLSQR